MAVWRTRTKDGCVFAECEFLRPRFVIVSLLRQCPSTSCTLCAILPPHVETRPRCRRSIYQGRRRRGSSAQRTRSLALSCRSAADRRIVLYRTWRAGTSQLAKTEGVARFCAWEDIALLHHLILILLHLHWRAMRIVRPRIIRIPSVVRRDMVCILVGRIGVRVFIT